MSTNIWRKTFANFLLICQTTRLRFKNYYGFIFRWSSRFIFYSIRTLFNSKKNIDGFSCFLKFKLVRLNIDFIFFESRSFMCNTIRTPWSVFLKDDLVLMIGLSEPGKSGGPRPPDFSRPVNPTIRGGGSDYALLIKS